MSDHTLNSDKYTIFDAFFSRLVLTNADTVVKYQWYELIEWSILFIRLLEKQMNRHRTRLELYGQPQGNEMVYGTEIIRRLGLFEFDTIDIFPSSKEAHAAYADWMDESAEKEYMDGEKIWANAKENILKQKDNCPIWKYTKPIIGLDENGQPITIDSWGK